MTFVFTRLFLWMGFFMQQCFKNNLKIFLENSNWYLKRLYICETISNNKIKTNKMKTTTKNAAAKRLSKLTISKTSIAYKVVAELLELPNAAKTYKIFGNTIRPVHTSGSGRSTCNMDYTKDIETLLSSIGIDTILSNDSARGGLTGNLLTVTTKIK